VRYEILRTNCLALKHEAVLLNDDIVCRSCGSVLVENLAEELILEEALEDQRFAKMDMLSRPGPSLDGRTEES
jgi:hypothetical protein